MNETGGSMLPGVPYGEEVSTLAEIREVEAEKAKRKHALEERLNGISFEDLQESGVIQSCN